jgi:hypothetical protein
MASYNAKQAADFLYKNKNKNKNSVQKNKNNHLTIS